MPDTGLSVTSIRGYVLVFRDTGEDVILTCIRVSATFPMRGHYSYSNEREISEALSTRFLAHEERAFKIEAIFNPFVFSV